ncbi:MAG: CPBP family intramembrane metalloprotease [Clostridiales bacterium]|nr:CPBP family intramembrane metalloprotease [Clostridiales bacterium]
MTIRKRLTPALATILFLLTAIACQVVVIKIFPAVTGKPLIESNAYILTRVMEGYLIVLSVLFAIFTRFKIHFECFNPGRERIKKDLIIGGIMSSALIVILVIIRLVQNQLFPEIAQRPWFGLYLTTYMRWFYPISAVLQELFVKGIVEDNITASCKKYNKHFSVWITALFFFVLHMGYDLPMMFGAAVLCAVTGYLYENTKSVWGSILVHFVIGFVPKILGVTP